ncbi:PD40 domain-containing protein [Verrucomicrobium spinosum]|uniref:PD40 domain-containing protein n=1 Tax=Verrucomicrobium spinosum TaxID=2736 RepID=UPI000946555D|nr:PD40 domain-containing protein [Verrucomicrobium spinosum]
MQFSPDGRHLLAICNDIHYGIATSPGIVQRWDYASRTLLEPLITHHGRILAGEFSPDGGRFLIVCDDNHVRTYHTLSGEPASPPISLPHPVSCAHFSPDAPASSLAVAYPCPHRERCENLRDMEPHHRRGTALGRHLWHPGARLLPSPGRVSTAAFSPDGKRIVTACEDRTARLWDASSGQPLGAVMLHEAPVNHASFSADGRMLLTGSGIPRRDGGRFAGSARLWDAATGRSLAPPYATEKTVRQVQFSPQGNNFLTISCQEDRADDTHHHLWSTSADSPIAGPLHPAKRLHPLLWGAPHYGLGAEESFYYGESLFQGVCSAAYHPTALSFATNVSGGTSIWSPLDGKPLGPLLPQSGAAHGIAYSPDGTSLVTARSPTGTRIWDVNTRDIHTTNSDIEMIGGVRINKDGLRLAVPMEERLHWKNHLLAADPASLTPWQSLTRWHLSPRNERPFSPHSPTTLAEQITRLTQKGFQREPAGTYELQPLKEAYFLDSTHPGAQLLAAGIWAAHADFLAPGTSFWFYHRPLIDAKSHSAIHHADRALALHPGLPLALRAKGYSLSWLQDHQGALDVRRQLCASPEAIAQTSARHSDPPPGLARARSARN